MHISQDELSRSDVGVFNKGCPFSCCAITPPITVHVNKASTATTSEPVWRLLAVSPKRSQLVSLQYSCAGRPKEQEEEQTGAEASLSVKNSFYSLLSPLK
jgi:hypothetical protein